MAMDYSGVVLRLANVASDIDTQRQRFNSAVQAITAANNVLGNMPTTYAEVLAAVDAGVAANPADRGWLNAQADKDHFVADFLALKAEVQAAVDALAAL
jgi:hypothetical protein